MIHQWIEYHVRNHIQYGQGQETEYSNQKTHYCEFRGRYATVECLEDATVECLEIRGVLANRQIGNKSPVLLIANYQIGPTHRRVQA